MLGKVSEVLDIDPNELKAAILRDHEETLNNYLKTSENAEVKELPARSSESSVNESSAAASFGSSADFKMSSNS